MALHTFSQLAVHGVKNAPSVEQLPGDPQPGAFFTVDGALYAYCELGDSVRSWAKMSQDQSYYVHHQTVEAYSWAINHELGSVNSWLYVVDETGAIQSPEVQLVDGDLTVINFESPTKGRAVVFSLERVATEEVFAQRVEVAGNIIIDESGISIDGRAPVVLDDDLNATVAAAVQALFATYNLGTASGLNVPAEGADADLDQVVRGDDSRLTDARPPRAHSHDDLYALENHPHNYATTGHTHSEYSPVTHPHPELATDDHDHDSDYSPAVHSHAGYEAVAHTHSGYSPVVHTHSGYAEVDHTHSGYSPTDHDHVLTDDEPGFMTAEEKIKMDAMPYCISVSLNSKPSDSEVVAFVVLARNFQINVDRCSARSLLPMESNCVFQIKHSGSYLYGEIFFTAGSSVGQVVIYNDVFSSNSKLSIHAPETVGDDVVNIGITLSNY